MTYITNGTAAFAVKYETYGLNVTNVTVIDILPGNLTYVSMGVNNSNGAKKIDMFNNTVVGGNTVKWVISNMTNGSFVKLWVVARTNVTEAGSSFSYISTGNNPQFNEASVSHI